MDLKDLFNETPFMQMVGIEVTEIDEGSAEGRLPYDESLRSSNYGDVVHGGATYALADTIGGAAVVSLSQDVCPTVDMRIDYLSPARTDLQATADVLRFGSNLATAQVEVHDVEDTHIATAHGTYKTGGGGDETPWYSEFDDEESD